MEVGINGVLRDDLRVASEDRNAIPIRNADFFAVAILPLAVAGDGEIDDDRGL